MISRSSQDPRDFLLPGLRNLLRLSLHTRFLSYALSSRASHSRTLFHASSVAFDSQLESVGKSIPIYLDPLYVCS